MTTIQNPQSTIHNPQEERARAWQRLQELENRALGGGLQRLSSQEVLELGRLYRRAASDLSQARSLGLNPREVTLLNSLVGRAYGLIYTAERGGAASVATFFTRDFPQCFRRNFSFIAAAFLLAMAGALVGLFAAILNPDAVDVLMGPGYTQQMRGLAERHQAGRDWLPADQRPFASSFIMTNNIRVSFLAFAGGVLLGLPTIGLLFYNGVMLGTISVGVARGGTALEFWGFVAPHGVIELPAIFVAGGAGLMLGYALVNPGEYSRRTALRLAGRDAVLLIFGVVAMLVIAGIIEAFFSPAVIPPLLKLLVAAVTFAAEIAYFALAGTSGVQSKGGLHRDGHDRQDNRTGRDGPSHPVHPVHPCLNAGTSERLETVRPLPPI